MNKLQKITYPNLLLVAGTGRNSGKTSFVCRICEGWNSSLSLVCIKISIHFHWNPGADCLYSSPDMKIYEETQATSDKDTERMLKAGASKVLFIEADQEFVYAAFQKALEIIPENSAIICESGSLRRYTIPSLFIMLHTSDTEPKESSKELLSLADKIFYFEPGHLQIPEKPVVFSNYAWKLNDVSS